MLDFMSKSFANIITLLNIFFGSLSLIHTLNKDYKMAIIFILLAVIMDGLDGRVARKLETSSDLGRELDSLCDLVSFGVAPALLVYSQALYSYNNKIGLIVVLLYIICGAFRLARFNVLNIKEYFVGIPITIAGTLIAIMAWFTPHLSNNIELAVMFILAIMMVSNFKVPKY